LPLSRRAWCRRCCRSAAVVSRSRSLRHVGVAVGVFALRVVLRSQSLRRVGVAVAARGVAGAVVVPRWCRCGHCAACGVAVAVVAPHLVLRMLSSCRGGVAIAVVAPHGCRGWCCATCSITVTVVAPCVVLRSRSLHRVGVAVTVFALRVVLQSRSLRRVWRRRRRRYVWFCGRGGWPWKDRTDGRPSAREVVRVQ